MARTSSQRNQCTDEGMLRGLGSWRFPRPRATEVTRKEGRNMRITTRTRRGGHLHGTADGRRLATARGAGNGERGVLAVLRALCPRRSLGIQEAAIVAELQANRLPHPGSLAMAAGPDWTARRHHRPHQGFREGRKVRPPEVAGGHPPHVPGVLAERVPLQPLGFQGLQPALIPGQRSRPHRSPTTRGQRLTAPLSPGAVRHPHRIEVEEVRP